MGTSWRAAGGATGLLPGNSLVALALLLVGFFFGATIWGIYLNFSPVPVADSWDGMVNFYLRSAEGLRPWWEKHNEHRIILSKFLFWLDMRYFAGSGLLLIPVNVALLLAVWWSLASYAKKLIEFPSWREQVVLSGALGMLCLSWMQNQNIVSSFQNMFILVFLLPLLSFYCFARALETPSQSLCWRLLSLALAAASPLCMANGIFALPLLAVLSWQAERSPRWIAIIGACFAASLWLFMTDYDSSFTTEKVAAKLGTNPWHVVQFGLAYVGAAFYVIFHSVGAAVAAGAAAILASVGLFRRLPAFHSRPFALALFAYVGYVLAAAAVTTYGRAMFDLPHAAASRYLTPTLTLWAAVLILWVAARRSVARWCVLALLVVAALLLPPQRAAFRLDTTSLITPKARAVAALALQMGIDDLGAKSRLALFYSSRFEDIILRARQARVSIFAEEYARPADLIFTALDAAGGEPCAGHFTFRKMVDEKRVAYRVGGSLAPGAESKYRYILFGDEQGIVKGIALSGRDADGAAGAAGPLGFDGYIFASPDFSAMRCVR